VSRYTKAAPGGECIVLDHGYQLCGRCGNVQCTADKVVAVYRAAWWGIYTHLQGPGCPAKAVSGWRAVELALDMRESNIPTPREAYPVSISGILLPFVSLLDTAHCIAEMAAVTISLKEFLPSESNLSVSNNDDHELRSTLGGSLYERRDWGLWQSWEVATVAVASWRSRLAEITRDVMQQERASLYSKRGGPWSTFDLSERDDRPMMPATRSLTVSSHPPARKSSFRAQQRKPRRRHPTSRQPLGHALTRDVIGKPGEHALYSRQKLTDGRRVLKFDGLFLDELASYRLSGPKPHPIPLPFDSARCPEMFDWSDSSVPKGLVGHWRGNPKSSPYGPVARLKPAFLAALRNGN
jgi:hypothetical protein